MNRRLARSWRAIELCRHAETMRRSASSPGSSPFTSKTRRAPTQNQSNKMQQYRLFMQRPRAGSNLPYQSRAWACPAAEIVAIHSQWVFRRKSPRISPVRFRILAVVLFLNPVLARQLSKLTTPRKFFPATRSA